MQKFYGEVLLNLRSFIDMTFSKENILGAIYASSTYLLIMAGMIWLYNSASSDNKYVLFYILLAIASMQAVLQERKIILMQKKIDEGNK